MRAFGRAYPLIVAIQVLALVHIAVVCWTLRAPISLFGAVIATVAMAIYGSHRNPRAKQGAGKTAGTMFVLLTAATLGLAFSERSAYPTWNLENLGVASLLACAAYLTGRSAGANQAKLWYAGAMIWSHASLIVWLSLSYLGNHRGLFYCGLVVWVLLWILMKSVFRLPGWGIQVANSAILVLIGVPVFSVFYSPYEAFNVVPSLQERPYAYENAAKDPAAYSRWLRYNGAEWERFYSVAFKPGLFLVPNARTTYFESVVEINSKGFRGPEIPEPKGEAYRIVALGESTTFGITMERHDRPWPELLQQLVYDRLKPGRPVQVINVGVPMRTLKDNLERLSPEILQLKPDLILSYHGFNGFKFIYDGMPPIVGKRLPRYQPRPVAILASAEYAMAIRSYRERHGHDDRRRRGRITDVTEPLATEYANLYRQLIDFCATNRIRLALATYSMAANEQSPREVIDFYRMTYSQIEWQLKANAIHSAIVEGLTSKHPNLLYIDTRPRLDGDPGFYTDLVHFTAEGKQQMAEIFFTGIEAVLRQELYQAETVR